MRYWRVSRDQLPTHDRLTIDVQCHSVFVHGTFKCELEPKFGQGTRPGGCFDVIGEHHRHLVGGTGNQPHREWRLIGYVPVVLEDRAVHTVHLVFSHQCFRFADIGQASVTVFALVNQLLVRTNERGIKRSCEVPEMNAVGASPVPGRRQCPVAPPAATGPHSSTAFD